MSASFVGDVAAAAKNDPLASKDRPEVAAVLLRRLNHALNAAEQGRADGSRHRCDASDDESPKARSSPVDDASMRAANEQASGALANSVRQSTNDSSSNRPASQAAPHSMLADELLSLLERSSAGVYVGERSSSQQRVLLTLEGTLSGAAAEIVRDGAHLMIRLHAGNESAYRTMLTQRHTLEQALREHELPQVSVEILPVGGLAHARHE